MNNIYLVNDDFNFLIELNFNNNSFNNNTFINYKNSHNFEIISKNEIIIFWNKLDDSIIKEYYITNDSYIYYKDNIKNTFKKIFLIHNEWNDQALLNFNNNTITRIEHKDQYGTFSFNEENKLVIIWNYWGKEIYNNYDEYNYYNENYIIDQNKSTFNNSIKIHIFIHITLIEEWIIIFNELIDVIKSSGLYDKVEKIHLGILSDFKFFSENNIFNDPKFNILYIDSKLDIYEINTINHIKNFCEKSKDEEIYILYVHTKGVRNAGNKEVTTSWRAMMNYFLIEKHNECLNYLEYYDTLGNNNVNLYCDDIKLCCVNENHTIHYSGNFWWSKKSYINKLNYINYDNNENSLKTRYKAENWICSKYPDAVIGIIFQDITNTHPYHRYVFEYYKNFNFNIKKYIVK